MTAELRRQAPRAADRPSPSRRGGMKRLILVWLGLIALLIASAASASMPLGGMNGALSLLIAIAKASLVALFFMHLRHSITLIRLIAIMGLVLLGVLFVLAGADVVSRPQPGGAEVAGLHHTDGRRFG